MQAFAELGREVKFDRRPAYLLISHNDIIWTTNMTPDNKIIVTGGAGYIGSHTVVELFNAGYVPVIVDDFSNADHRVLDRLRAILGQPVTCHEGDCKDAAFLSRVFTKESGITGVIHFAAFKAVGESVQEPLKYYHNNLMSLVVLLKAMMAGGVSHLVFSSSCTVYGQPDHLPVTEETLKKPAFSPYGRTKQICEEILEDTVKSHAPLKVMALRYFNPIGAHPSSLIGELPLGVPNNLVPFITQTAAGIREKLTVFGDDYDTLDGTCVRDYIHVVDLGTAHVKALQNLEKISKKTYYDVVNIGTGKGNSVMEVIQVFEKVTNVRVNYVIGKRREGDIEKIYANADKSRRVLNWQTQLSLEDALRDAWHWQKRLGEASSRVAS